MPNCDFYAHDGDFETVISFVFEELACRVFECYSEPETELVEFNDFAGLKSRRPIGSCKRRAYSVHLNLWPVEASDQVTIERIKLDPDKCNGKKYRFQSSGWGLIQLYLGGRSEIGVVSSHTNHNTEKRAYSWANTSAKCLGSPKDWDWREVTRVSSKLNRYIRRLSQAKVAGRPVLPDAARLLSQGVNAL